MKIILVADAHAGSPESPFDEFFRALSAIPDDSSPVIFLGDIFDICFTAGKCENDMQRKFFNWCSEQKKQRFTAFVEGNREFFISRAKSACFSAISDKSVAMDEMLFIHGDMLNSDDRFYRTLRLLVRNDFIRFLISVCPFADRIIYKVKAALKRSNQKYKKTFPEDLVRNYIDSLQPSAVKHVLCGHFHQHFELESSVTGIKITGIDSWENCRKFAVLDTVARTIEYTAFQSS